MKKVVRLTESDLARIVKRVIEEQSSTCFQGWEYIDPKKERENSNIRGLRTNIERYEKYDPKVGSIRLYKDMGDWNRGSGQIIPTNIEITGKVLAIWWQCVSGKLVYKLQAQPIP